ncbi:MAG: Sec-independent protein translocase protein TatB [Xanthomonadales bacterium]|nr:Sec-independent protein translocase protein TatB [Xanthomonadales bacterium]
MFDIGFWEISLLGLIGLMVLGPERLPAVARVVGGYLRKARRTWANVRSEIEEELAASEIRDAVRKPMEEVQEAMRQPIDDLNDLHRAGQERINLAEDEPQSTDAGSSAESGPESKTP